MLIILETNARGFIEVVDGVMQQDDIEWLLPGIERLNRFSHKSDRQIR